LKTEKRILEIAIKIYKRLSQLWTFLSTRHDAVRSVN